MGKILLRRRTKFNMNRAETIWLSIFCFILITIFYMVGHLYELAANDLYIKPQHPSISGISLDIEECAQLLEDGDYTLGIRTSSEAINIVSMTILKMDQDLNYREYDLNLCFTNSTRINLNHNYLSLLPFYSDYIENDILTEPVDSTIISGVKNYYFLHVENGYGTVFQKPLNVPYTADRIELLLKIQSAAKAAGYITK